MATFEGNSLCDIDKFNILKIAGKFSRNGSEAAIKFKSGLHPEADTVLSIEFDIDNNQIVLRSHKYNEICGSPKRILLTHTIDFFKILVIVSDEKFDIALDDAHLCTYEPELPISRISGLFIDGDLAEINRVDHCKVYPTLFPPVLEDNRKLNFSADVARHFRSGDKISIEIIPKGKFSLSLGNYQENFITIAGKTDENSMKIIEATSPLEKSPLAAKWTKNVPLKVNFTVQDESILISIDDETLSSKLKIDEQTLIKLYKITAESKEDESLEVRQIIYN